MAMRVEEITIGVDVSKDWLDICTDPDAPVQRIGNSAGEIRQWLQGCNASVRLAVEPTNHYHEEFIEQAHEAGHRVYLVDALRLARYREAVAQRAKTDSHDARLLQRYLTQEGARLRCWRPCAPGVQQLWRLLKRRAGVVRAEVQLRQSLSSLEQLPSAAKVAQRSLRALLRELDRELLRQAQALGWTGLLGRLCQVPGVGPLSGLSLLTAWHRGEFSSADRFVAFLGLDVRVRDSGRYRGRRKLSKKGEPEIRRLLYVAAMSASRTAYWKLYYQALRARGLSATAAFVVLSRKIVRLIYALLRDQAEFDPSRRAACAGP